MAFPFHGKKPVIFSEWGITAKTMFSINNPQAGTSKLASGRHSAPASVDISVSWNGPLFGSFRCRFFHYLNFRSINTNLGHPVSVYIWFLFVCVTWVCVWPIVQQGGGGPKYKGDDLVPEMILSHEPSQVMTHGDKRPPLDFSKNISYLCINRHYTQSLTSQSLRYSDF